MTWVMFLLLAGSLFASTTSSMCIFVRSGDRNLIKRCLNNCQYGANGSYIVFELTRSFDDDEVVFTLRDTNSYRPRDMKCLHKGTKVVCHMGYAVGFKKLGLSAMKGNVVVNSSRFNVRAPLKPCHCIWDELKPIVQGIRMTPGSKKMLQLGWAYLANKGNAERNMRVRSEVCIKKAGTSECTLRKCQHNYIEVPHLCKFHVDNLDYTTRYDICVRSESWYCQQRVHETCVYNKSLGDFYFERYRLSNVSCGYDFHSQKVSLKWNVEVTPDHNNTYYSYSLYNEKNMLLMEGRTDSNNIEQPLTSGRTVQKFSVKLCLNHGSCSKAENTICVRKGSNNETLLKNKNLLYLLPGSCLVLGVIVVVMIFCHIRNRREDTRIKPTIDGKDLELTYSASSTDNIVSPNPIYAVVKDPLPKDDVFDTIDQSPCPVYSSLRIEAHIWS